MDTFPLELRELLVGYRGRLAVANNCQSADKIHRRLQTHFPPPARFTGHGIVPSIAAALVTPVRTLLQDHTVYPYFAAFPRSESLEDESKSPYSDSYSTAWLRLARPRLALCPTCAAQDLDTLHISYWRRDHQLPGVFHCAEHDTELLFMPVPPLLTDRPHELLHTATRGPAEAVDAAACNPVARQSTQLLHALLACRQTVSREEIAHSIQRLAFSGLSDRQTRNVIGDVSHEIARQMPAAWLADLMPHSKGKRPDRMVFVTAALGSDSIALSAAAVVLLLSLFKVSKEAALSLMSRAPAPIAA